MNRLFAILPLALVLSCTSESEPKENTTSVNLNDLKIMADSILEFNNFTLEEYTANYDENEPKFRSLENFFSENIPDSTEVEIEFKNSSELEILAISRISDFHFREWDLKIGSQSTDSLIALINWTNSDLDSLYRLLLDVDCISISNYDEIVIGYKRSGLAKYNYKIFDHNLTAKEIEQYNECMYIFHRDNVVLEYGSGAIGSLCFPERYREKRQLTQ